MHLSSAINVHNTPTDAHLIAIRIVKSFAFNFGSSKTQSNIRFVTIFAFLGLSCVTDVTCPYHVSKIP